MTEWVGLLTFAGEGGGLPSYGDTFDYDIQVETNTDALSHVTCPPGGVCLPFAMPVENNLMQARPLRKMRAPKPDFVANFEIVFAADPVSGVNLAYVNGETFNPHPTTFDLENPALLSYMSTGGGPLTSAAAPLPTTGAPVTLTGDAKHPFVLPLGAVVEFFINNTVRSASSPRPARCALTPRTVRRMRASTRFTCTATSFGWCPPAAHLPPPTCMPQTTSGATWSACLL